MHPCVIVLLTFAPKASTKSLNSSHIKAKKAKKTKKLKIKQPKVIILTFLGKNLQNFP